MFRANPKYVVVVLCALALTACATDYSRESTQKDTNISMAVQKSFARDPELKSAHLAVVTTEGAVDISGVVDSLTNDERALELAHQVEGVSSVKDDITIRALPEIQ